jgi:hypothetical protein
LTTLVCRSAPRSRIWRSWFGISTPPGFGGSTFEGLRSAWMIGGSPLAVGPAVPRSAMAPATPITATPSTAPTAIRPLRERRGSAA